MFIAYSKRELKSFFSEEKRGADLIFLRKKGDEDFFRFEKGGNNYSQPNKKGEKSFSTQKKSPKPGQGYLIIFGSSLSNAMEPKNCYRVGFA